MSLNFGTLRSRLGALTHRTDVDDDRLKDFVRSAEGVIARRLRCVEMIKRASLAEVDRVTGGIYTLPSDWLEERAIWTSDDRELSKVSLGELRAYSAAAAVQFFCPLSSTEIEFRGAPGTDATLELLYFARPAALDQDSDTNEILTRHEGIYLNACKSELYLYTQDLELADAAAQMADAAIETLNEQAGRLLAGARAEGFYCLSTSGSY